MNKKEKDLDVLLWFMPQNLKHIPITEKDIKLFYEYDEKGLHKDLKKLSHFTDGFNALIAAKTNRGRNMEFWEDGVMSGTQPYFTLLGGYGKTIVREWYNPLRYTKGKKYFTHNPLPRNVVDFAKKEMFKGIDANIIEKLYQEICNKK